MDTSQSAEFHADLAKLHAVHHALEGVLHMVEIEHRVDGRFDIEHLHTCHHLLHHLGAGHTHSLDGQESLHRNRHVKLALAAGEIGLQNDDAVDLRARHAAIQTHFAEDVNAYIHTLAVGQFQDFLIPVRVDLGVDGLVRAQSLRLFKTGLHFAHDDHTCAAGFCERDGCGTQTTSSLD